ncbi:carbon-nitrogen hydrolase family protein [Microbacterium sp. ZXX196]|uniref:carbon-nitrogen hydrolase family protein n=1 Tax=Microbacterium sp. ZXX196 TaxID=2609291 RepID=UPI0012BA2A0E|nr:carbon-nitrogen hydrolase family protein [Microbacterium sp. ZXX196]MTE22900.1 hydrolase [Microbacterium sp. ZXX196]
MTTPAVGIALAQFAPGPDPQENAAAIAAYAEEAAARGAGVLVAPEYSSYFVTPFDGTLPAHAEPLDGPFAARLAGIAAETGVTIVAGLVEEAPGDRVRNAVIAVDGSGVRATYRKQHLYDAFGERESDHIEPGALGAPETFVVGGLRFGLMTCYDLRFPESARILADAGVDVAVVPAEWVRGPLKEFHWETLVAARAIENTMFVAAADHPAPVGVGASRLADPSGVTIAALGPGPGLAMGWADREAIAAVRAANPALALRRYRVVAAPSS